jgi:GNAT superfamily N-acetyltransferase
MWIGGSGRIPYSITDEPMNTESFQPLTPERWDDFEQLFGPRGACGGCWCMYWKLPRKDFKTGQGEQNHHAQKEIVASGGVPGLLAYVGETPAGWVAIEPRQNYPVLGRSRILKPLDDNPVWSVTCFFVTRNFRNLGLTVRLLKAAIAHAERHGGRIVEGYPVAPQEDSRLPPVFVYTGIASAFIKAGFKEAGRRSETRPIMRYFIQT